MATAIQNAVSTEEYLAAKFAHTKSSSDLKTNIDYLRGWIYAALDSCPEFEDRNRRKNANPYPVGTINHFRFNYGMNDFYSSRTIFRLTPRDTKYDAERMTYHSQPVSRQTRTKTRAKRSLTFWVNLHKQNKNN